MCLQDTEQKLYLFLFLYADDAEVLAECPEDLQRALDILKIHCEVWGLDINVRKTKVVIFSRGGGGGGGQNLTKSIFFLSASRLHANQSSGSRWGFPQLDLDHIERSACLQQRRFYILSLYR